MFFPVLVNWRQSQRSQILQEGLWMGQFTHGLQTEVAAISCLLLVIDLDQDRTDQAKDRRLIRKHTDHIRSALDLLN